MLDGHVNQQPETRSAPEDGKYRIYARVEIAFILRAIMKSTALVTAYFGPGKDFIVTAILAVDIDTQSILIDSAFHQLDPDRRNEAPEPAPVILEDNVWLAARVIVLPGVRIGKNSVVGAGSVVTRDIPPDVLAAGIPAKVIRPLRA